MFLINKLKSTLIHKKPSKGCQFFIRYFLISFITLATMIHGYTHLGYHFDFRSVPIFLISYTSGWGLGLLVSILPALYRLSMGIRGANVGIILGMLLPVVMGALLGRTQKVKKYSDIVNTKRIIIDFFIFVIIKMAIFGVVVDMPFKDWLEIAIGMIIFWTLSTLSIVIIYNDLNKQIRSEKRLKISEERYKKLVESLPDGVLVYKDDKIVLINEAAIELIGMDNKEEGIVYKHDAESEKEESSLFINNNILKMLMDRKIQSGVTYHKIPLKNGEEIDIDIRGISLESEGELFIINIVRDITNIKRTQLLEEKIKHEQKVLAEIREYDRLKTEFFANLSHELRTPLNLLFSTIQLIEFETKDKEYIHSHKLSKKLKILKQNSNRMAKLANNLIDITKIDSGYFELCLQNCDIVRIIEDITLSVAEYIEFNDIELIFDTDVEEKIILVDPSVMERIILNLLSNAVKFSKPNNQILVSVYDHGEEVVISVKDRGNGIPMDKLEVIFERFRQVDKLLNRCHEGSGIGLSLVKSLVAMHGGEISVESRYGVGSEFIIKLPAKETETICNEGTMEEFKNRYGDSIHIEFSDIY